MQAGRCGVSRTDCTSDVADAVQVLDLAACPLEFHLSILSDPGDRYVDVAPQLALTSNRDISFIAFARDPKAATMEARLTFSILAPEAPTCRKMACKVLTNAAASSGDLASGSMISSARRKRQVPAPLRTAYLAA